MLANFHPNTRTKAHKTNPKATDVEDLCMERIEQMLAQAASEHNGQQPALPLLRLRLECANPELAISANQFAQKLVGRAANPKDVILFKARRQPRHQVDMDLRLIDELAGDEAKFTQVCNIDDVISEYFEQVDPTSQLDLLFERLLTESVREFVEKDTCRMQSVIDWHLKQLRQRFDKCSDLPRVLKDEQLVREMAQDFKESLRREENESLEKVRELLKLEPVKSAVAGGRAKKQAKLDGVGGDATMSDDDEVLELGSSGSEPEEVEPTPARGRGRGRGRAKGTATAAAAGRGRAKASTAKAASAKGSIADYMCIKR